MKKKHLNLLICPRCGSRLHLLADVRPGDAEVSLFCTENGHTYALRNGIPRFVDSNNYADSFGYQWRKFSRVQFDSYNGTRFSEERFRLVTGWNEMELAGKLVLDAGCGAGRFAEVAIKERADLVAFDLSEAVDVCKENLAPDEPLICQASIYQLPFHPASFDFVYCIGVVQHTPDPAATIRALCRMVKPGGQIGLWIYERDWKSYIGTLGFKYALRPILHRLSRAHQYAICNSMVRLFLPLAVFCRARGLLGKMVMRLLPIASAHLQSVPLQPEDFSAWVLLDTFDMYSPAYDRPQTYSTVTRLLADENFENIQRHPHGGIAVTATRRA